jgi:HEAT repeat protein
VADFISDLDRGSFIAGAATGWATAYAAYRARHFFVNVKDMVVTPQADSTQEFAGRSDDARYSSDLIKHCQTTHLAGHAINLSEILVEPRFIAAQELVEPPDDDVVQTVFHVVPKTHDHPFLHSPYNIPDLTVDDLGHGDRMLTLLGLPGSGRTTALQAIALWCLGEVRFDPMVDPVQQQMESDEKSIKSNDERAQSIRDRLQIEEMAKQSLAEKRGTDVSDFTTTRKLSLRQFTPVYAHFANINVSANEFGRNIDPAEPLLRALQHYTGRVTSRTMAAHFYNELNKDRVLLLLDGFDDLPHSERPRKLEWLRAYLEQYGQNFVIVAGPANGYGGLLKAGLSPMFLRPWRDRDIDTLANKWAESWQKISGIRRKGDAELESGTLAYAKARNRTRNPFEITMKLWKTYDLQDESSYQDWLDGLLTHYLPERTLEETLPSLIQAAILQLDEGYITLERFVEVLSGIALPDILSKTGEEKTTTPEEAEETAAPEGDEEHEIEIEEAAGDLRDLVDEMDDMDNLVADDEIDDDLTDLLDDDMSADFESSEEVTASTGYNNGDEDIPEDIPEDKMSKELMKELNKIGKEYVKLFAQLHKNGLLVYYRGNRYQFRHKLLADYLASLSLQEAEEEHLLERASELRWQQAIGYASMHTSIDAVVKMHIEAQPDILHNNILEMARWVSYTSGQVEWRSQILRILGNAFVAHNQYLLMRERLAAALISMRDKNTLVIFRKALGHPNPDIRRLSCLGIGALQMEETIEDISNMLIDDDDDVTRAAGLALGAIGTEDAIDTMVVALTDGEEGLRQAVAETLAAIPEDGYPILFDAVYHEDHLLRRAAVFGLQRVNTSWSLIALYRRALEDDQWIVRSAAEIAFQKMHYGDKATGIKRYPEIESIPWLRDWLVSLGTGDAAVSEEDDLLVKALNEGDELVRALSAITIGQLGLATHTEVLYMMLRNQSDIVRESAHRALGDMQRHIGQPLPSPM